MSFRAVDVSDTVMVGVWRADDDDDDDEDEESSVERLLAERDDGWRHNARAVFVLWVLFNVSFFFHTLGFIDFGRRVCAALEPFCVI
jgi:hypothetical protein